VVPTVEVGVEPRLEQLDEAPKARRAAQGAPSLRALAVIPTVEVADNTVIIIAFFVFDFEGYVFNGFLRTGDGVSLRGTQVYTEERETEAANREANHRKKWGNEYHGECYILYYSAIWDHPTLSPLPASLEFLEPLSTNDRDLYFSQDLLKNYYVVCCEHAPSTWFNVKRIQLLPSGDCQLTFAQWSMIIPITLINCYYHYRRT